MPINLKEQPFAGAVGVGNLLDYTQTAHGASDSYERMTGKPFDSAKVPRVLQVGLLINPKTAAGESKGLHRPDYPTTENIEDILGQRRLRQRALVARGNNQGHLDLGLTLHFVNSRNRSNYAGDLASIFEHFGITEQFGNKVVDGVQVNGLDTREAEHLATMRKFKDQFPDMPTIVQFGGTQLHEPVANLPEILKPWLLDGNQSIADWLWLDGSGGEGKLADYDHYGQIIDTVWANDQLAAVARFGVAGGLDARNLERNLTASFDKETIAKLSWDAEGGVQERTYDPEEEVTHRRFDRDKAAGFLVASAQL